MDTHRVGNWPFTGRADDVELLHRAMDDPKVRAVVITAPAGAGKTRLARETTTSASEVGPVWIQCSAAMSDVPFGVLAHMTDLRFDDPGEIYRRLASDCECSGGVVVIDDAPHLDARTADLMQRLVNANAATIIATARADVPVPSWMEWLWLGEASQHLELGPLDEKAIGDLVAATIEDLTSDRHFRLVRSLSDRTQGNALFLRELLIDLRERLSNGGDPSVNEEAPAHLLRVLQTRLESAGAVAVALRAAAILGDLRLSVLRQEVAEELIDAAEKGGWLVVDSESGAVARPAHPLYAEASLAATTTIERLDLTGRIARRVLADSGATSGERLRATAALVDIGTEVELDHLVQAALTAFSALDHELATRLCEAALSQEQHFEAQLILGAAHSGAGRLDEAESALRAALRIAVTDDERARSAGRLSVHLVAAGGRIDEAAALLEEIEPLLEDPAARSFVAADRAKLASIRGDLTAASPDLPDDADDLSRLNAAIVGAYVQSMAGDAAACRQIIEMALPLAEQHSTVLPWSSELVRFSGPFAALLEDGPQAAETEAREAGRRTGTTAEATSGTWGFLAGFASAIGGRLAYSAQYLDRAIEQLNGHDLINARPLAIATRAWVAAQAGEPEVARALLDKSVDAAATDGRVRMQVAVVDAWCDVLDRGPVAQSLDPRVSSRLLSIAEEAVDGAQSLTAIIVLHELARLGDPLSALSALEEVTASMPPSVFSGLVVDRARAEANMDDSLLRSVISRSRGRWPVLVAEMHAARARVAKVTNKHLIESRSSTLALLAAKTLGPVTPVTLVEVSCPLTPRELEIAEAVAAGGSNREVADCSEVSVRTVENQLQSIYRKLDLDGRQGLVELVNP